MLSKILSFLIRIVLTPVRLLCHGVGHIFMYIGTELEKVEIGLKPVPIVVPVVQGATGSTGAAQ